MSITCVTLETISSATAAFALACNLYTVPVDEPRIHVHENVDGIFFVIPEDAYTHDGEASDLLNKGTPVFFSLKDTKASTLCPILPADAETVTLSYNMFTGRAEVFVNANNSLAEQIIAEGCTVMLPETWYKERNQEEAEERPTVALE